MATEIELPDGTILEAPDDADPSVVAKGYLARQQAQQQPATQSRAPKTSGVMRQLGLGARAVAQAGTDLLTLPGDFAAGINNAWNRTFRPEGYYVTINGQKVHRTGEVPLGSQQRDDALTAAGLPVPATPSERVTNVALRGAGGAAGVARTAAAIPAGVAQILAQRPTLQMVSGATGGASAGTARELGYGPLAQLGAGLAGGMTPALVAPRVQPSALQQPSAAAAASGASARATPGVSSASTTVTGGATARGTGGGHTFGTVGADPDAALNVPLTRVAERGRELGFRMTPGQATGSRALQQLEAKLESQPMTSGPFNSIKQNNQTALNRSVAEALGVRADVIDEVTLSTALRRMEAGFQGAADDVTRQINPREFISWIGQLQDDVRGLVKGVASEPLIEDITRFAAQGGATGKQLHSLSSRLGKAAYKQMSTPNGDRDLGHALYRAKDYVDEVLVQGMDEARLAEFTAARQHYRNLMMLTSRVGTINPASGNVSGRSLASVLQRADRRGYLFGTNRTPMYDAARFAQGFQPIVGDSGTATRSALPGPTDFLLSLPFNLATRAYTSSPSINLAVRANSLASAGGRYGNSLAQPPDLRGIGPYYNALADRRERQ